jgi:hypothetical protein
MALKVLLLQPTAEERKPPWPAFCRRCGQLIALEESVRRCYRGFLYHEHVECPREEYGPLWGLKELVDSPSPRAASRVPPARGNGDHNRELVDNSQPGQSSPTVPSGIP